MAKLVLSTDGAIVHQCFLDAERVTIGRDAGNAIVVDDPAVAALALAIVAVGNDYILDDLGGAGDVMVNGAPALRRILQHGDVIELGAHHLRYLDAKASSEIDLERTMMFEGLKQETDTPPVDRLHTGVHVPSARVSKAHFPDGRIRWLHGARTGETRNLDRVIATIGKPGTQQAVLTRRPHGYFLAHVEGRATARVNGRAIGKEPQALRHGDIIEVGVERVVFEII
ncbi:MAG: FHA domain-containing protein [Betaproteobacteria bacterium]